MKVAGAPLLARGERRAARSPAWLSVGVPLRGCPRRPAAETSPFPLCHPRIHEG